MAMRYVLFFAVVLACAYGIMQRLRGFNEKYFNIALCGMTAILLARLYYLTLVLSHGNDTIFTVGTLGQASAYLFFITANVSFLPKLENEKLQKRICIPGVLGIIFIVFLHVIPALSIGTVSAFIGESIYCICMCCTFYEAVKTVRLKEENSSYKAVAPFNICVCLLTLVSALYEFILYIIPSPANYVVMWVLNVLSVAVILIMLPLLRKGMKTWSQ